MADSSALLTAVRGLFRDGATPADFAPFDEVELAAREERVVLLLADRLRIPGFEEELRENAVFEAVRTHELRAVLAALSAAGVRPVLLKGASIARTHYPRPELRPRMDTDLMIPASAKDAVAAALVPLGYRRKSEIGGEIAVGQFHFQKQDPHGTLHALDVHWRVSNARVFADVLTYEELARDAVPLRALGDDARGTSSVHGLLLACVHLVAHHSKGHDLLWLFDIHLLARSLSAREREEFIALASARRMRAVCAHTLTLARDAIGGIDARLIEALSEPGMFSEPSAAFLSGGIRQVDILRSDLAATPGWPTRLRLIREHLFPSAEFMYDRYRTRTAAALPWLYLRRIVTGLPKWFRR